MCGLYGVIASKGLVGIESLVYELGCAAAVRGTDATGIAYLLDGKLEIEKASKSAYNFRVALPKGTRCVLGHTRRTTQGSAKHNYNNHPFRGLAGHQHFALAHNGVIYNEKDIRSLYQLEDPKIETDSYIAVQLLEHLGQVNFETLKEMAEVLEGMFTITIMETDGTLWIVRNDNPITVVNIEGSIIYASTPEILMGALAKWDSDLLLDVLTGEGALATNIKVNEGEIVKIKDGKVSRKSFEVIPRYSYYGPTPHNITWWDDSTYFAGRGGTLQQVTPSITNPSPIQEAATSDSSVETKIREMAASYDIDDDIVEDLLLYFDQEELLGSLYDGTIWDFVMLLEQEMAEE